MCEESSQNVTYEEISKGHLSIPALCSGFLLCTLYSPSVTSRNTSTHIGVSSSLSATGWDNFGLSGFIDLRFPFLWFATLGLPRINLVPLPNFSYLYIWPFIPPSMQTAFFFNKPYTSNFYIFSCNMSYHSIFFDFALSKMTLPSVCCLARNLETFLTSLSHRICKYFLNSISLQSQLHLPVTL